MSHCLTAYPQPNFASVIDSINRELQQKGHLSSNEDNGGSEGEDGGVSITQRLVENRQLITEMRAQNFDVIRFASYRTACKLRFIQKRTNLYLIDIWNVIEAFRENSLNNHDLLSEVHVTTLESVLSTIFCALNKRLPNSSQIDVDESIGLLYSWLLSTYDINGRGALRLLSIKASLSTLCCGRLIDKLRYAFTLVSDSSGNMVRSKFENYLHEVLALPSAVFEGPSFEYSDNAAKACFDRTNQVTVNDFIDILMSEPGPQCLMWLPILNRLALVENVFHPVQCEACHRESFSGFRYKCQRCYNYHLCQDCFWRGRTSGNHSNDHEVKEYSFYKSPAKQLGQSLKKSIRCIPSKSTNNRNPRFSDNPEKTLDLSHIVPATPQVRHGSLSEIGSQIIGRSGSLDRDRSSVKSNQSPNKASYEVERSDDEHRLIARYTARLAADANSAMRSPCELGYGADANRAQRELIAQLEAKNRSIMLEIQRLRLEQEQQAQTVLDHSQQQRNPVLMAELKLLRQRRDELELRMAALQDSRKELMIQLEGLMKLLRNSNSPRSSPNVSPRCLVSQSPLAVRQNMRMAGGGMVDSLTNMGGNVRQAFNQRPTSAPVNDVCSMRNNLLVAADSVTDAMSSLVKELNSETSSGSEGEDDDGFKKCTNEVNVDEFVLWQREMQNRLEQERHFLQELHRHRYISSEGTQSSSRRSSRLHSGGDSDSYNKTDEESCVMKTDEEDNELYDRDPQIHY